MHTSLVSSVRMCVLVWLSVCVGHEFRGEFLLLDVVVVVVVDAP